MLMEDFTPLELYYLIAEVDVATYRSMLNVPKFALSLTPGRRTEFMILFGYSVKITRNRIEWYFEGELHRADGPAFIDTNDCQAWYFEGKLHRIDGPAVIYEDGQVWWVDGKLHRVDGPAVIRTDGYQSWYFKGKPHRTDGPAVIYANGNQEWWVENTQYTKGEFDKLIIK